MIHSEHGFFCFADLLGEHNLIYGEVIRESQRDCSFELSVPEMADHRSNGLTSGVGSARNHAFRSPVTICGSLPYLSIDGRSP